MLMRRLLERGVDLQPMSALHEVGEVDVAVRNVITNRVTTIGAVNATTGNGISALTNGGDITITWDNGANKIFKV